MERKLNTPEADHPARWWHTQCTSPDRPAKIRCDLCPRDCLLAEGERGACHVRRNLGGRMRLATYGRSSGFAIAPVEKTPLYHFHPGSAVLSLGTAGCNLGCAFCGNGDAQSAPDLDRQMDAASPDGIAGAARAYGAQAVAFTHNDPVVYAEYAIDTAAACHRSGVASIAASAAYLKPAAARDLFAAVDAASIGLKAFTDAFYARYCGGHLQPVLDALCSIRHETRCWLEISTPLLPGLNDSAAEIRALAGWIARELGRDVPWHVTALRPDARMRDRPACTRAALDYARQLAIDSGLFYVYTDAAGDSEGGTTFCPECGAMLIERDGEAIMHYDLPDDARCPHCRAAIAGHFGGSGRPFDALRIPVRLARR